MARLPRYTVRGLVQHVIQRGNNRAATFATSVDYRFFRDCLQTACDAHGCQIHAYVLMTNHVHLLMTPSTDDGIGKVIQSVGRRYVQHFNRAYRRTGTLWEGRYRATLIDSEGYLLACYRYIELNPVRAGLVPRPEDYRWSSYRANAFGATDALVTVHELYRASAPTRSTVGQLIARFSRTAWTRRRCGRSAKRRTRPGHSEAIDFARKFSGS